MCGSLKNSDNQSFFISVPIHVFATNFLKETFGSVSPLTATFLRSKLGPYIWPSSRQHI